MAPTVSYWDCGEFIAVSHTLGVPHPPGSPFFLLLGRIFSMIPFNDDVAFRVNIISPLVSALAVMLLYLSIVKVVTHWRGKVNSSIDSLIVFGGGVSGALAFAFTDSHWFNAVEAEVYAFSTFFTAIVVWLILLWNEKADEKGHERYLLIIAYMIGLATGLHLLNLLAIPFITLIVYFRKYKVEWKSFGINVLITAVIFFVIHMEARILIIGIRLKFLKNISLKKVLRLFMVILIIKLLKKNLMNFQDTIVIYFDYHVENPPSIKIS